jgi:hypothetical protein
MIQCSFLGSTINVGVFAQKRAKKGSTINVGVFAQKRAKKMHAGSFIHYP